MKIWLTVHPNCMQGTGKKTIILTIMEQKSKTFRNCILPTLKRSVARYGGTQALSDFRVLAKIQEELMWYHQDIAEEHLQQARIYLNNLKPKPAL